MKLQIAISALLAGTLLVGCGDKSSAVQAPQPLPAASTAPKSAIDANPYIPADVKAKLSNSSGAQGK